MHKQDGVLTSTAKLIGNILAGIVYHSIFIVFLSFIAQFAVNNGLTYLFGIKEIPYINALAIMVMLYIANLVFDYYFSRYLNYKKEKSYLEHAKKVVEAYVTKEEDGVTNGK